MSSSVLWLQFAQIMLAHALAVASPGPDFALVLRQSLAHGRRIAGWTSVGIGSGILVHVSYSLLGVGLVLSTSRLAFSLLQYAGATYLAWLGARLLWVSRRRTGAASASTPPLTPRVERSVAPAGPSARGAWLTGFLTNVLNPKATLFFLALFPTVVDPRTPRIVQAGYGFWMALATAAWFLLVSHVFTRPTARAAFGRWSHWIDRLLGVVFLGFALGLATTRWR